MAASANPILANKGARDPTLFCTGYKKQRFYLFTRSEPEYVQFYISRAYYLIPEQRQQIRGPRCVQ
jgi:hypothetical protein